MVFTVQVLRNQERINSLTEQIQEVLNGILQFNIIALEQGFSGSRITQTSKQFSTQQNNLEREKRALEEENAFLIRQLGFNPIDELDTLREQEIIIEEQLLTTQNNTLRNALIIGGVLLLI